MSSPSFVVKRQPAMFKVEWERENYLSIDPWPSVFAEDISTLDTDEEDDLKEWICGQMQEDHLQMHWVRSLIIVDEITDRTKQRKNLKSWFLACVGEILPFEHAVALFVEVMWVRHVACTYASAKSREREAISYLKDFIDEQWAPDNRVRPLLQSTD